MKKRIFSLLLALSVIVSLLPSAALAVDAATFTDVQKGSWYYEAVDFVTSKNYFVGTSTTEFSPDVTMTRAMFVTVLSRLDGETVNNNVSPFADVPAGEWYTGAVKWASDNNIVAGIGNNLFDPNGEITREQMCVIMDNYINYYSEKTGEVHKTEGSTEAFPDAAQISAYAVQAVANCREYDLISGFDDGKFYPQANSTRAQVAVVISRLAWLISGGAVGIGGSVPTVTPTSYTITYQIDGTTVATAETAKTTTSPKAFTTLKADSEQVSGKIPEGQLLVSWKDTTSGKTYAVGTEYYAAGNLTLTAQLVEDTDYIALAVNNTMVQATETYAESVSQLGVSAVIDPAAFSAEKTDENTRPQSVSAGAGLSDDVVVNIITMASSFACQLLGPDLSIADVKETVSEVIDAIDANVSEDTANQIANSIYDAVKEEGKSLWSNFYDADGDYYTGNVTVTVGNKNYTVQVNQTNHSTTFAYEKKTVVKEVGIALAKEMYSSLKQYTEPTSSVTLTSTVTFTFTDNKDVQKYSAATVSYPHVYPVTIALNLDGGELLSFRFDTATNESYVIVNVTEKVQASYAAELEKVMAAALVNGTVVNELETRATNALSGNQVIASLGDVLTDVNTDEMLAAAVKEWVAANTVTTPAPSSANYYLPYEFFWDDEGTIVYGTANDIYVLKIGNKPAAKHIVGNNSALYDLIQDLSKRVAAVAVTEADATAQKDYGSAWTEATGAEKQTLLKFAVETELNKNKYSSIPTEIKYYLVNLCVVTANYDDISEYQTEVEKQWPNVTAIVDQLVCKTFDGYSDYLTKVTAAKELKRLADVRLGNLATLLDNATFQKYVEHYAGQGTSAVEALAKVIDNLPQGASVKIGNVNLNAAALSTVKSAKNLNEVCRALADVLNTTGLSDLTVNSFSGDGQPITVTYNGRTFTFRLVVTGLTDSAA